MAEKQKINDLNLPNEITLPFCVVPQNDNSDALNDFFIRFTELVNYICEVLLFSHLGSKIALSDFSAKPEIKSKSFVAKKIKTKLLSTPKINVNGKNLDVISKNLSRNLFHHSISQLVTNYEIFLNELTEDILWRNEQLLAIDEKQLSTKQIFELGTIESMQEVLIERKILDHVMTSYPKRVEKFQKLFQIGIHSKSSPLPIHKVHDLIEVRNVIQHNDGYCTKQYLQRMEVYKDEGYKCLIKGQYSDLEINFVWVIDFGTKLLALAEFIDEEVAKKWKTTRNSD